MSTATATTTANYAKPFEVPKSALYLHVPYEYRNEVKQMGAWYDPAKKSWYVTPKLKGKEVLQQMFGDASEKELRVYLHPNPEDPTVGNDPGVAGCSWDEMNLFARDVKQMGAKWDKNLKLWFMYKNNPALKHVSAFIMP